MPERVTKTTARESIREARQALRDLEAALREDGPTREYILTDDEIIARVCGAVYDTRDALTN